MILENHASGCVARLAKPSRRFVCLDEMMEDLGTAMDDLFARDGGDKAGGSVSTV